MARPRKQVDAKQVLKLAKLGCSQAEIGEVLGCSDDTLRRHFAASLKKGRAELNVSLRKAQIDSAKRGNATMLIWLGKQLLGQRNDPPQESAHDYVKELVLEMQKQWKACQREKELAASLA